VLFEGGQLGLWIGMSLLSVVEFVQYFILRICACVGMAKKYKKAKKLPEIHKVEAKVEDGSFQEIPI